MELLESHPNLQPESLTELQLYLDLMHHHLQDMQRSLDLFAPWLSHLKAGSASGAEPGLFRRLCKRRLAGISATVCRLNCPSLGQAAEVYDHIQTALERFRAS